ncbi:MAG: phosphate acyltransferase PlsX [Candidatus Dadabacteria bacterium]|nr:MAG: phosphate acyltransferase PlsX [Candidatus Dadabacteria bacterium]
MVISEENSRETLPVAVDVMGADHGPEAVIDGAICAFNELGIRTVLVGDQEVIKKRLRAKQQSESDYIIRHTDQFVGMDESPSLVIRGKNKASVRVAFELLKEGRASAVVSAGNTGAMMAAGVFVSGTLPGIVRPAIATLIPRVGRDQPTVFLDSGANVDTHAFQLVQFALMGSFYAHMAFGVDAPRVALLSNGTEASKGTDMLRAAAQMLGQMNNLNFVGYVEGRDIPRAVADVIVCDGFVGNIVLKTMEGSIELVLDSIRHYVEGCLRGKLGMWLAKPVLRSVFNHKLNPAAYGGAPLLGLKDAAIVCHGSSNSRAIRNGIRVADKMVRESLLPKMSESLGALDLDVAGEYENGLWNRMGQRLEKNTKLSREELKNSVESVEQTEATDNE